MMDMIDAGLKFIAFAIGFPALAFLALAAFCFVAQAILNYPPKNGI